MPRSGDTVELPPHGGLFDVAGVAFVYGEDGVPPTVIVRVEDF
jgi:hypothetical protein